MKASQSAKLLLRFAVSDESRRVARGDRYGRRTRDNDVVDGFQIVERLYICERRRQHSCLKAGLIRGHHRAAYGCRVCEFLREISDYQNVATGYLYIELVAYVYD